MTHRRDGYPVDYTAQNAREFNALKGVEFVDARVNTDGQLVAIFDVSGVDPDTVETRLRSFADALIPADEVYASVKFEELSGDVVPLPESKVIPMPGLES